MLFLLISTLLVYICVSVYAIHALIALILLFVNFTIILFHTEVSFLGFSYLLVYVGALSVLFLFIILLINLRIISIQHRWNLLLLLITLLVFVLLKVFIQIKIPTTKSILEFTHFYDIHLFGSYLFVSHPQYMFLSLFILFLALFLVLFLSFKLSNTKNLDNHDKNVNNAQIDVPSQQIEETNKPGLQAFCCFPIFFTSSSFSQFYDNIVIYLGFLSFAIIFISFSVNTYYVISYLNKEYKHVTFEELMWHEHFNLIGSITIILCFRGSYIIYSMESEIAPQSITAPQLPVIIKTEFISGLCTGVHAANTQISLNPANCEFIPIPQVDKQHIIEYKNKPYILKGAKASVNAAVYYPTMNPLHKQALQALIGPLPVVQPAPVPAPVVQPAPVPAPVVQPAPVPAPVVQPAPIVATYTQPTYQFTPVFTDVLPVPHTDKTTSTPVSVIDEPHTHNKTIATLSKEEIANNPIILIDAYIEYNQNVEADNSIDPAIELIHNGLNCVHNIIPKEMWNTDEINVIKNYFINLLFEQSDQNVQNVIINLISSITIFDKHFINIVTKHITEVASKPYDNIADLTLTQCQNKKEEVINESIDLMNELVIRLEASNIRTEEKPLNESITNIVPLIDANNNNLIPASLLPTPLLNSDYVFILDLLADPRSLIKEYNNELNLSKNPTNIRESFLPAIEKLCQILPYTIWNTPHINTLITNIDIMYTTQTDKNIQRILLHLNASLIIFKETYQLAQDVQIAPDSETAVKNTLKCCYNNKEVIIDTCLAQINPTSEIADNSSTTLTVMNILSDPQNILKEYASITYIGNDRQRGPQGIVDGLKKVHDTIPLDMWFTSTEEMTDKAHPMYMLKKYLNDTMKFHEKPGAKSAAAHMNSTLNEFNFLFINYLKKGLSPEMARYNALNDCTIENTNIVSDALEIFYDNLKNINKRDKYTNK